MAPICRTQLAGLAAEVMLPGKTGLLGTEQGREEWRVDLGKQMKKNSHSILILVFIPMSNAHGKNRATEA